MDCFLKMLRGTLTCAGARLFGTHTCLCVLVAGEAVRHDGQAGHHAQAEERGQGADWQGAHEAHHANLAARARGALPWPCLAAASAWVMKLCQRPCHVSHHVQAVGMALRNVQSSPL